MWLLKLDASGTKQWSKTYGGSSLDEGSFITTTADGGYAITGTTMSTDGDLAGVNKNGGNYAWIVKLDAFGVVKWTKIFGGTSQSYASSLVSTPGGQYIVSGYTRNTGGDMTDNHGREDGFILALDGLRQ